MEHRALDGRAAIVTGAGEESVRPSPPPSPKLAPLDPDRAHDVAGHVTHEHGVRAIGLEVDFSDTSAVDRPTQQTETELGPVDIPVNNAAIDSVGPFLDSHESSWDRIIAVNLKGTIACCHRVLGGMVDRRRGRVVNIGADAGKVGSSGEAVYSATKGGVIALTKTLAREVVSKGVTVNCVCPGPTQTVLLDQLTEAGPKLRDSLARSIPLRRIAQPATSPRPLSSSPATTLRTSPGKRSRSAAA